MPLCDICHYHKMSDAPCRVCGFVGLAEGRVFFVPLPSSLTLVNDARAMAQLNVRNFLCEQEEGTDEPVTVH